MSNWCRCRFTFFVVEVLQVVGNHLSFASDFSIWGGLLRRYVCVVACARCVSVIIVSRVAFCCVSDEMKIQNVWLPVGGSPGYEKHLD